MSATIHPMYLGPTMRKPVLQACPQGRLWVGYRDETPERPDGFYCWVGVPDGDAQAALLRLIAMLEDAVRSMNTGGIAREGWA